MTPTEAALRKALEEIGRIVRTPPQSVADQTIAGIVCEALAAPPHGKDAGEERYSMSAGEADQRMGESRAVRKALGFDPDSIHVAPVDLTDAIEDLIGQRDRITEEFKAANDGAFRYHARLMEAEGLLRKWTAKIAVRQLMGNEATEEVDAFLKKSS